MNNWTWAFKKNVGLHCTLSNSHITFLGRYSEWMYKEAFKSHPWKLSCMHCTCGLEWILCLMWIFCVHIEGHLTKIYVHYEHNQAVWLTQEGECAVGRNQFNVSPLSYRITQKCPAGLWQGSICCLSHGSPQSEGKGNSPASLFVPNICSIEAHCFWTCKFHLLSRSLTLPSPLIFF